MGHKTFVKVIIFLSLIGVIFIYCNVYVNTQSTSQQEDNTIDIMYSQNVALLSIDSSTLTFSKGAQERISPASLTKIMSAIIVIENCQDLTEVITITDKTMQTMVSENASTAGFEAKEKVSYRDLLYGLLLSSGGECGLTLANDVAGSESAFVNMMNDKAKELELSNTQYTNVNGFDDQNHYASVEDIAFLLQYALKNPVFKEIFTTLYYTSEPTTYHPWGISMTSTMLNGPTISLTNGEILGGKTGYTDAAGLCLATYATINGQHYILVNVGAKGNHMTPPYHILEALHVYQQLS